MTLLDEALAAHGGADALDGVEALTIELRGGGLAFRSHGLPSEFTVHARIDAHRPHVAFSDLLGTGRDAVFTAQRVTVGDDALDNPRDRLGTKRLRWDHLDFAYFSGYALWNYVTTPWLLTRAETEELPRRRLRARFPPEIPTHSRVQTFHFDEDGLLTRLDYTAEPFGRWARAAHVCGEHRPFGPIVAPARRRVTPRLFGRAAPGPTLVHIEVLSIEAT